MGLRRHWFGELDLSAQAKRDYYEILGIVRSASEQEIKDAFLKLAAEFQAAGKPKNIEAVERFREIGRAFRVLGDPAQRSRYDRLGENGIVPTAVATGVDVDQLQQVAAHPWIAGMGRDALVQLEPWVVAMMDDLFRMH